MRCQWLVPGHSPYLFCFLRNGHNPYLHLAVKSLEFLSMLATGNCIGIPHNSKILVFLSLWRIKYHLYGEAYLYFLMSNNSIFFSLLDKRSAFSYIWELELYAGKAQIFFVLRHMLLNFCSRFSGIVCDKHLDEWDVVGSVRDLDATIFIYQNCCIHMLKLVWYWYDMSPLCFCCTEIEKQKLLDNWYQEKHTVH
jgi:hypothetical protein